MIVGVVINPSSGLIVQLRIVTLPHPSVEGSRDSTEMLVVGTV